jgi:hypothetical protein
LLSGEVVTLDNEKAIIKKINVNEIADSDDFLLTNGDIQFTTISSTFSALGLTEAYIYIQLAPDSAFNKDN